ncbi:MAG: hypothetical protein ABIP97_04375 [Chthoniobacterales bacterium]
MIKTITRMGNVSGIILDGAFLEHAGLKVGDQFNVEVHANGSITFTPLTKSVGVDQASKTARRLIRQNAALFQRLAGADK